MSEQNFTYENNESIIPIPIFREKKCEKSNYIVKPTSRNIDRYEWHNSYILNLIDMYNIVINVINDRYPNNKIKWKKNEEIFHNFSRLIYHCSSKHISEYI